MGEAGQSACQVTGSHKERYGDGNVQHKQGALLMEYKECEEKQKKRQKRWDGVPSQEFQ